MNLISGENLQKTLTDDFAKFKDAFLILQLAYTYALSNFANKINKNVTKKVF